MGSGYGNVYGGKYQVINEIGEGGFGKIYKGVDILSGEKVAIKVEKTCTCANCVTGNGPICNDLLLESEVYKLLSGGPSVPNVRWFGTAHGHNAMVMDLLGQNLEFMLGQNFQTGFTLKTVIMLGIQMIQRLEFLHSKNFVHRDLKPSNFVMGDGVACDSVYLIDLGTCKKFVNSATGNHITCKRPKGGNVGFTGTPFFAPISAHIGQDYCRRDDMEALGYILIYLLKGDLPWSKVCHCKKYKKQKYDDIAEMKMLNSVTEEMCKDLPEEFTLYFQYCKALGFTEQPDYNFLTDLLRDLFNRNGYQMDNQYDWKVESEDESDTSSKEPSPPSSPEPI